MISCGVTIRPRARFGVGIEDMGSDLGINKWRDYKYDEGYAWGSEIVTLPG